MASSSITRRRSSDIASGWRISWPHAAEVHPTPGGGRTTRLSSPIPAGRTKQIGRAASMERSSTSSTRSICSRCSSVSASMRSRRSRSSSPANSNARRWPASTRGIRTRDPRSSGFVPRATMSTSPREGARRTKRLYEEQALRAWSTGSSAGTPNMRTRASFAELEEPFLAPLRRVNRAEVHAREAEDPPELIGARRPEAGEVVVEQDIRAGDPVLHRSESAGPFLHLRGAVNLDPAQVAQGTIADEPEVDEIRGDFRGRVQVLHFVPDERHLPPSQGLEDVRSHPGAVTEFDRVSVVPGRAIEERKQAVPAVFVVQERRGVGHQGADLPAPLPRPPEKNNEGLPGRGEGSLIGEGARGPRRETGRRRE